MAIQLETCEHGIIVRVRDSAGTIRSKIVDPEDVANVLAKRSKMDTGLLPRNTRYYARQEKQRHVIVLEVPEHIRRIDYAGVAGHFDVPIPYTCFFIVFNADQSGGGGLTYSITGTCLYVTQGPILDNDTVLYTFPYGNVFHGGSVCWGSVPPPVITSLTDLAVVPELILGSRFNSDLSAGTFTAFDDPDVPGIRVDRSEHLLRYLNGKTSFKYDILLRAGTFGEILRRSNS